MKRIDLTQFEGMSAFAMGLIAELKRMYDREDALIAEAKDLVVYDEEDEMWVYDAEKASNPGLDAMDFVVEISTMND